MFGTFDPSLLHETLFFLSFMTSYSAGLFSISPASAAHAVLLAHPFSQDLQVLTCLRTWLWGHFCPLLFPFILFLSLLFCHFYVLSWHKFHLYNDVSIPELLPWSFQFLYPTVNLTSLPECLIGIVNSACLKQNS